MTPSAARDRLLRQLVQVLRERERARVEAAQFWVRRLDQVELVRRVRARGAALAGHP